MAMLLSRSWTTLGGALLATLAHSAYVAPPQLSNALTLGRMHSQMSALRMAGNCVVTDGTDSFFGSRTIFQALHDYGDFDRITAFSSSIVDAKKMCISRQSRYSGLIDVLDFAEGGNAELITVLGCASTWVCVNADEAALPAQLAAAQSAGVGRVFIHVCGGMSNTAAIEAAAGSLDYTVMVTGKFGKAGVGGGLIVGDASSAADGLPIDDAFRVLVEGLTIPEASRRSLSLSLATDGSQLREMRMAGCTRREECKALFKGQIKERTAKEIEAAKSSSGGGPKVEEVVDERSDEEKRLAQEEEVKALLVKARVRGEENQKRMAAEEAIKQAERAERLEYMKANMPPEPDDNKDKKDDDDDKDEKEEDDDDTPKGDGKGGDDKPKGDGDGDGKDKKDGDDDGLALA